MEQVQDISVRPKKTFSILRWALVIGIVVVLNLFFNVAINLVYPQPQYTDFCKDKQVVTAVTTQQACVTEGGKWTEEVAPAETRVGGEAVAPIKTTSYCDRDYTCRKDYDTTRKTYERNVFAALVILGVLSLITSFLLMSTTVVALGMSLGGVLSFIIASMRYWSEMSDLIRVVVLGLALIVLIWLGVKKFQD